VDSLTWARLTVMQFNPLYTAALLSAGALLEYLFVGGVGRNVEDDSSRGATGDHRSKRST